MTFILCQTLYIFFVVLEFVLMAYVFMSWIPLGAKVKHIMHRLTAPILDPIRFLLKHSIFYSQVADLSPIVGFVIVSYMQQFFYIQLM